MIRVFVRANLIPALLACIVFFTTIPFIESAMRIYARTSPAIEWHDVQAISRIVRPGDVIEIVYTATINRQCPSDVRAFIVAPDGSVPVRFPPIAGGYTKPSNMQVEIRVKLPMPMRSDDGLARLQSGMHIYRATATRYCPEGVENDDSIPDAEFRLEVPE